jgi:ubiquinone/menaquinone biosynthesis C-methylase UbiE
VATSNRFERQPEPEYMDDAGEAQAYAEADFNDVNQAFAERVVEHAGPAARREAADLGTGPGDISILIARLRPGWHITAIDAAPAMLALARAAIDRAGLGGAITLLHADAKATALPGGAFDLIFSNSLLHHVTDTASLWREIRRIARPRASFFMRDLARPASSEQARALVEQHAGTESALLREEFYRSLLSAYTVDEIGAQLAEAGLSGLSVRMVTDRHLDVFGRLP